MRSLYNTSEQNRTTIDKLVPIPPRELSSLEMSMLTQAIMEERDRLQCTLDLLRQERKEREMRSR
jgi:hypothetical protein